MCGIVGFFSRRTPNSETALRRATASLRHRGPDGQRHWMSRDGRVALGHARLSIIDLTTGDQPIASENGKVRIVVNGEFYGYESIQRELEQLGHRMRTRSDSEIALHLYEEVGIQCLHRLRGEFAFVLWDETNRRIFAARDRFGIKPLFYALHKETLYLASEAKALFAAGVPANWDAESVYHILEFGGHPSRTLFDGVFQIPPGYYLIATDKHIELHRYWDFDYPPADHAARLRPDVEYAAQFRDALEEAVKLRLRADVPVGCYLSGGLDSCAVLGLAAKHYSGSIRAFTLTFDRAEYDEGEIAREMAAKAGAEFVPIPIRQDDLADHFADAIAGSENLCGNAHGVAKYLLSRAVRNAGYKVVLTGEGSDEILAGYPHFRRDVLLHNAQNQDADTVTRLLLQLNERNSVSRGLLLPDGNAGPLTRVKKLLGFVPSWMEAFSSGARKTRALCSESFLAQFAEREDFQPFLDSVDVRGQLSGRDPLHQALYLWAKAILPAYILTMLGDRMEMAHSVEGRVPFLDHHVVEVIRSQPPSQKVRGMVEKYVLREGTRDVITDTVYQRQKHPFVSPPSTLNPDQGLNAFVQDTLRGPILASIPFFDQNKVVSLLDALHAMDDGARVANDQILMTLVSICVLHERFHLGEGLGSGETRYETVLAKPASVSGSGES
jgi:asparagine synthase (glutamine-hydrolysing)